MGTASLIMGSTVTAMKKLTTIERPDGSNKLSFPSGSTAIAFMGAEFLYQEYKEVSIWYGISGYLVATGTGFLRLHNNKHWFTDVVGGAGIGILSTKIAYWIHPLVKKTLFKDKPILHQMLNEEIELNFISENEDLDFIEIETKTNNIFKF